MGTTGQITNKRRRLLHRLSAATLAVLAAGCGGSTTLGVQPEATTTTVATTTTTTLPPTTTTTIDFNRPVDQRDTPLPPSALAEEVIEVVDEMRGQTDGVSAQLSRLVEFPKLASPLGSQILDFSLTITKTEDGFEHAGLVAYRVPSEPLDMVNYFDAELQARGWISADETSQITDDGSISTLIFREPGTSGDDLELAVVVDVRPGVILIELNHHQLVDDDDERFELLHAWQETIRTPSSAEITTTAVSTMDDTATLVVTHRLDAETAAEARADMIDLLRPAEFESDADGQEGEADEGAERDASPLTLTEVETGQQFLVEFSPTREEDVIEMTVSASFNLTPID